MMRKVDYVLAALLGLCMIVGLWVALSQGKQV
jgi:hypothetical protein